MPRRASAAYLHAFTPRHPRWASVLLTMLTKTRVGILSPASCAFRGARSTPSIDHAVNPDRQYTDRARRVSGSASLGSEPTDSSG
ncbi:hypothetical protein B0H12DRAFT_1103932 [Mycena haematopus]|nr:hypothetical protein B0H12DRAFT_1103932 [Mycena haematopus]